MRFQKLLCLAAALILMAGTALASPVDTFTITGVGVDITFSLPATPTPSDNTLGYYFTMNSVPVTVNGSANPYTVDFYNTSNSGGLDMSPGAANQFVVNTAGAQLYSGSESTPTFVAGVYPETSLGGADYNGPFTLTIATPEPSMAFLILPAFMGIVGIRRKLAK